MNPEDLKPHDINVTETPKLGPGGTVTMQRTVTFFIGTHGPFQKIYDAGQYSAAQVKTDIQNEIDQLASIHSWAQ